MDRDLERLIRGFFAAYRLIKRLNAGRKKLEAVRSEPRPVSPLWQRNKQPLRFESMDTMIAKERERGYMP